MKFASESFTHQKNRHVVDFLFIISLLFFFALSILLLIALGANIYQKIVTDTSDTYALRSSYAYITQKARQADDGSGTRIDLVDGQQALVFTKEVDGKEYETYLYAYDGQLRELFVMEGITPSAAAGSSITPMQDMELQFVSSSVIEVTITEADGTTYRMHLASK